MNRNRYRRIVLMSGGVAPYVPSPAAASWKADIIANGGTISDAVLQVFDEQFFIPAVANGNILTEADRIHFWITNSNNIAARTSVEGNNYFASFVNAVVFDDSGIKSDGVSAYVNLNYNAFTHGVLSTQNDTFFGYIVKTPTYTGTTRSMGSGDGVGTLRRELYRESGVLNVFVNSTNADSNSNTVLTGNVLIGGKRMDNANQMAVINASEVSSAEAPTGVPNTNVYELTSSANGTPIGDYDLFYHLASVDGSASFDYTTFMTLIDNLEIALAAL